MTSEQHPLADLTFEEAALDVAGFSATIIPLVGGPIGHLLAGASTERKWRRLRDFVLELDHDLADLEDALAAEYVRTEDFEEIMEETLVRVSRERSDRKCRMFRTFSAGDIRSAGGTPSYDQKIEFLRDLESVQPAHIELIAALVAETVVPGASSRRHVLRSRLAGWVDDDLTSALGDLARLGLANHNSPQNLGTMVTEQGAHQTAALLTARGHQFRSFLLD